MQQTNATATSAQKKLIKQSEFDKKVEIEASHLMYFEYMRKDEAFTKAERVVMAEYQIG